ncbi:hypothetical protein [Formicincola oecophyllae]|uniref:hypothetical protein n=1 Tax=Formicincola oecophyllae TaxID=2558361 RepID=UPI0011447D2A|nr:hypothetical protein [Formicincola oecophyllae]
MVLLLWVVALRWALLGNPLVDNDDNFYLYAGGRLWAGDVIYADVWDRKPWGMFAFYGLFDQFGPWRFWAAHCAAVLAVWGTGLGIVRLARTIAPATGAWVAAFLYVACLNLRRGYGIETPVFYNLLMVWAVWMVAALVLGRGKGDLKPSTLLGHGACAMALVGLAMQFKPTTVFEGCYLGLILLALAWRARVLPATAPLWRRLLLKLLPWCGCGLLWAGLAFLPTLAVALAYAASGHGHDWWFANVDSLFLRHKVLDSHHDVKLAVIAALLALAWPLGWLLGLRFRGAERGPWLFISGWALIALLAVIIVPGALNYYALPLMAPFAVLWAPLWRKSLGRLCFMAFLVLAVLGGEKDVLHIARNRTMGDWQAMQTALSNPAGCVFQYLSQGLVLEATPQAARCHVTNLPFPNHLADEEEQGALPRDTLQELARILALRPQYLVASSELGDSHERPTMGAADKLFLDTVKRDYVRVYAHPRSRSHAHLSATDLYDLIIWRLRPGLKPLINPPEP